MSCAWSSQGDHRNAPSETNESLSTPSWELVPIRSQVGLAVQGKGEISPPCWIGEAKHPSPPECPPTQVASHWDIVDCLEFDLTRCDSAEDLIHSP